MLTHQTAKMFEGKDRERPGPVYVNICHKVTKIQPFKSLANIYTVYQMREGAGYTTEVQQQRGMAGVSPGKQFQDRERKEISTSKNCNNRVKN